MERGAFTSAFKPVASNALQVHILASRRDLQMSPLTTLIEDAATEFLTRRIRLSGLLCTVRLGLGALNPDRGWAGGGEGTQVRKAGKGCGRLTGIQALTPKDRGDEQRQQHQRLGSPEADHGSPWGLAEPGPGEAQRGGRARSGSGSLPRPHAGGPRGRRKRQETRQPCSALRLLPAEAPVICARSLQRLAKRPKPRAAPQPPAGL